MDDVDMIRTSEVSEAVFDLFSVAVRSVITGPNITLPTAATIKPRHDPRRWAQAAKGGVGSLANTAAILLCSVCALNGLTM